MLREDLESWTTDPRKGLLRMWAESIVAAATGGHLDKNPLAIKAVQPVIGPRAGALLFLLRRSPEYATHAGRLVRALSADKHAAMRQLLPTKWTFDLGSPSCYMDGRLVRAEMPWPATLAQSKISLRDLASHPLNSHRAGFGRWIAGQSDKGTTVTLGLGDETPHWLIAGTTGSGKSVALLSAVTQLAKDVRHRLIFFDGKFGDELQRLSSVAGMVGPLVTELDQARSALGWLSAEMKRRFSLKAESRMPPDKFVLVWDEPQEWLKDKAVAELVELLSRDGRAVGIHIILATHHPTVKMFGSQESRRSFPGRIALRVTDMDASRVVLGFSHPSATSLTGAGDSIISTPRMHALRAQLAFVDERDFEQAPLGNPEMEAWPDFDAEAANEPISGFVPQELAAGLLAHAAQAGRPTLRTIVETLTGSKPGGSRAQRLQRWTGEVHELLEEWGLFYPADSVETAIGRLTDR